MGLSLLMTNTGSGHNRRNRRQSDQSVNRVRSAIKYENYSENRYKVIKNFTVNKRGWLFVFLLYLMLPASRAQVENVEINTEAQILITSDRNSQSPLLILPTSTDRDDAPIHPSPFSKVFSLTTASIEKRSTKNYLSTPSGTAERVIRSTPGHSIELQRSSQPSSSPSTVALDSAPQINPFYNHHENETKNNTKESVFHTLEKTCEVWTKRGCKCSETVLEVSLNCHSVALNAVPSDLPNNLVKL